jgi:aminopeptidase N
LKNLLLFSSLLLLLTGCYSTRLHTFGEVPKKPGHYPSPSTKDILLGELDEDRAAYDVTSYNLDLTLNPDKKEISGEVIIAFNALKEEKSVRFDLAKNLKIYSIKYAGKIVEFSRFKQVVYAHLPHPLEIDKNYSITVSYGGRPTVAKKPPWRGGMVWNRDKDGNPWVGVTVETDGASTWFPCKDHLSDEPDSVKLRMTVPAGIQVVSNGVMKNHSTEPGIEIYTWSTHYPINIYNITFYAGNFVHFGDTMTTKQGPLKLDYYVLPENPEKAKKQFEQVKDVINIYSESFGPYPWIREGFKLVEAPFEGMEHQTAIAYGSGFANLSWLGGDYIIVHETAHEWWGNAVTVSDFSDIWLQEGFATYSEMIFAEKKLGYDASLFYAQYIMAPSINNKLPVVGPKDVSYWDYKDADVYYKGAMILHTIRNVIGDSSLFFNILQTFYSEHAAKSHVTTADFKEVLERKTGMDWTKFFEAYLYDRRVPVLNWYYGSYEVDSTATDNKKKSVPFVVAKWMNVPEGFNMPVTLEGYDCKWSAKIAVTTKPSLFWLGDMPDCNQINSNKKRSYYDVINGPDVFKEYINLSKKEEK